MKGINAHFMHFKIKGPFLVLLPIQCAVKDMQWSSHSQPLFKEGLRHTSG